MHERLIFWNEWRSRFNEKYELFIKWNVELSDVEKILHNNLYLMKIFDYFNKSV